MICCNFCTFKNINKYSILNIQNTYSSLTKINIKQPLGSVSVKLVVCIVCRKLLNVHLFYCFLVFFYCSLPLIFYGLCG